ncbi:MAG: hypothetical protein V3U86_09825 [Acidobacteriota bacterium]
MRGLNEKACRWVPIIDEEHCIEPCQDDAIRMAWVAMEGDCSVGRWRQVEVV